MSSEMEKFIPVGGDPQAATSDVIWCITDTRMVMPSAAWTAFGDSGEEVIRSARMAMEARAATPQHKSDLLVILVDEAWARRVAHTRVGDILDRLRRDVERRPEVKMSIREFDPRAVGAVIYPGGDGPKRTGTP